MICFGQKLRQKSSTTKFRQEKVFTILTCTMPLNNDDRQNKACEAKKQHSKKATIANRSTKIFCHREVLRRMLIEPSSLLDYTVCEKHEFEHETHSICIGPNSKPLSYKLTLLKDFSPKSNKHEPKYSAWIGTDR